MDIMTMMTQLKELLAECDEDDLRAICGFALGYAYAQLEFGMPVPFTAKGGSVND